LILKPLANFSGNGILKGTIVAYSDEREPLGWEMFGNYSAPGFREKAAKSLATDTGIGIEKANALFAQVLKTARKAVDVHQDDPQPSLTEMKAILPNLVDIVASDSGTLGYLFLENGFLKVRQSFTQDGKVYVPPAVEHMPYLIPRETEVRRAFNEDDNISLFTDLIKWHQTAGKLAEQYHYQMVVLFDLHTYLADRADYSPYLVFQTLDAERGKSRQGNSMAWVSYRGIVTETLQEANLFRWADSLACTLFFDVRDIVGKAERRGADDILLGRFQKHGAKVARVLDPQAGPFKGVSYFNVYGPTIMALNEPLKEPYLSRSIVIVPPEATGKYPNLNPQMALPLKERLVAFRARHLLQPLPQIQKPVDGRLGDSLQPFGQIAAIVSESLGKGFPDIAKSLARERAAERAESKEARLISAVGQVAEEFGVDLPIDKIKCIYNEGLGEKSQLSEESVGRRLKGMGFKEGTRKAGGQRTRVYDPILTAALRRKFGLDVE